MKNLHLLSLLVFLLLLNACNNQKQQLDNNGILTIDFKLEPNDSPSDIFETVFIKLETNENCFIDKTITQIELASDKLFILSGGNERTVYAFDLSGNFITQIGSRGSGPGEYIIPMSFSIDYQVNILSILDMAQKKILRYDLNDFSFISEERMNYDCSCFEYLDDNKTVWKNMDYRSDYSEWEFLITDMEQNLLDKVVEKKFITGYSTGRIKTMYKVGNKVFAYSHYDPYVYCFQDGETTPLYHLTFGKHLFPPIAYLKKISANDVNFISELITSDYISNYSVFDVDKTLCVYYSVAQTPYIGIYDKEVKRTYSYAQTVFQDALQIGRIDQIAGVTDNYIVAILQPFELLSKQTEDYMFSCDLQLLIAKSLSDDNPILCLFRIKTLE
jgi:hypothetical protein